VGVLDDHALLVESMASWIGENCPDMEVVLRSTTWTGALANDNFPPDVFLMDYQLVEPISIETRILTCRAAGSKVIVLSALGGPEMVQRVVAAGADSFFVKTESMHDIVARTRVLFAMPALKAGLGSSAHENSRGEIVSERPRLSASEKDALVLYVQGNSTREVADILNVQYETAKTFLRRAREKYARAGRPASRRADLVRRAAEDGYLT
jgi:DNA-binding NarL/FixJ family response regulator